MWIRWIVLFTLTGLAASCADPTTIGVVIRRSSPIPAVVRESFEEQTGSGLRQLLVNSNLQVAWRAENEIANGETYDRVIVLRFRGDCTLSTERPMPRFGPLGATWMTDGRILPFIEIDCGRVKATLSHTSSCPQALIAPAVFAHALSRVALHEIYHVLSERTVHDNDGLFKAAYSAEDLLNPALTPEARPLATSVYRPTH